MECVLNEVNMSYKSEIRILDVGSGNQRFSGGLDDIQNKFIIGFEPDKRTFDSARPLGDSNKENGIVYPFALAGANGSRKLNLTRKPECSSFYMPNKEYLGLFPDKERWDV